MLILSIWHFSRVFLLAAIVVAVGGWLSRRPAGPKPRTTPGRRGRRSAGDSRLFRNDRLSSLNFWDNLLARFDFIEILNARMAQAQLEWSVGRVTAPMLFCGTAAGLLLLKIVPVWGALAGAIGVAFLPYGYILRARDRRFRAFRDAFPDVLDSMARALRAGYPLPAAVDMVAADSPEPIASELKKASAEANLGKRA